MKTVLITGAHGFLGRYCASEFCRNGYQVIGAGHGKWVDCEPSDAGIAFWSEGDITLELLTSLPWRPDIIVHAAGSGSVAFSVLNPKQDFERTVTSTLAVLEYARLSENAPRVVLISSAAVYGSVGKNRITENTPFLPMSPYGIHKRMAEELCREYIDHYGVKSSVVRFYSIYGAGLRKQLFWEACRRMCAVDNCDTIEFFGTGRETRDWLHARDAAILVRLVGESIDAGIEVSGGTGEAVAVNAILKDLAEELGWVGTIGFNGISRVGDPEHLCSDRVSAGYLGWSPSVPLSVGISEYVAWFRRSA